MHAGAPCAHAVGDFAPLRVRTAPPQRALKPRQLPSSPQPRPQALCIPGQRQKPPRARAHILRCHPTRVYTRFAARDRRGRRRVVTLCGVTLSRGVTPRHAARARAPRRADSGVYRRDSRREERPRRRGVRGGSVRVGRDSGPNACAALHRRAPVLPRAHAAAGCGGWPQPRGTFCRTALAALPDSVYYALSVLVALNILVAMGQLW